MTKDDALSALAAAAAQADDSRSGGATAGEHGAAGPVRALARDPLRDPDDRQRAAPVWRWAPADCGPIDMRIRADGLWLYQGTPIGRDALVSLFASILTKEPDGAHYLVTPAEKVRIEVEDVAFIAVDVEECAAPDGAASAPWLELVTNVGDRLRLGATRRLRVPTEPRTGEPTPYAPVRGRLEARIDRKTFYRLVDRSVFVDLGADGRPVAEGGAEAEGGAGAERAFGFWSGPVFYALAAGAAAEAIEAAAGCDGDAPAV